MCDFGASAYIALAAAAASAATSAVATHKSNKAQVAAVEAESLRQRGLQSRQQEIIAQQEAEKEQARKLFQSLAPEISQQSMEQREVEAANNLGANYVAAAAPSYGADPTRQGDAVSTVGSPTSTATGAPKALDYAYAQQLARALGFNTQQANARAKMDALGIAQNRTNQALQRGTEGIGLQGQIISGLGRNAQGVGQLMDASSADAQAQLRLAAQAGDDWRTASQIFGLISSGASAYGSKGKAASNAEVDKAAAAQNQTIKG